jgi:hypothetical protein
MLLKMGILDAESRAAQVPVLLQMIDADGDGNISLQEFADAADCTSAIFFFICGDSVLITPLSLDQHEISVRHIQSILLSYQAVTISALYCCFCQYCSIRSVGALGKRAPLDG